MDREQPEGKHKKLVRVRRRKRGTRRRRRVEPLLMTVMRRRRKIDREQASECHP